METNTQSTPSKLLIGAILIIIGGLFLLRSFQILPFEITHVIFSWRFGLLIIGIVILLNSNNKILGIILTTIGGLLLFPRIFPEIDIDVKLILGIVIIALGVYVIFRSSGGKFQPKFGAASDQINKDYLDDVAVFGGGKLERADQSNAVQDRDFIGGDEQVERFGKNALQRVATIIHDYRAYR